MRVGDSNYALYVGRLSPEKGITTLLEAWRHLTEIPLKVAGDGSQSVLVKEFIRGHGGANIAALGWQPRSQIIDLLKSASFLIIPSVWYEGFPLVIVEAFACGVPVIGSRIGGVGEVIRDEHSGLLFEAGNPTDLAAKVRRLWSDKDLRDHLGSGARHQYELHYTASRNYDMMMEIFESVLA